MKTPINYLLAVLAFLVAISARAEVYRWVDESGTVHYGDRPGSGSQAVEVEHLNTQNAPAVTGEDSDTRDEKRQRVSDMLEEDRLEKNKEKEEKRLERERKKRECNRLKDHQRRLKNTGGVYNLDKDGNRVFLSNEQRKKSEQKLNKWIQKACN